MATEWGYRFKARTTDKDAANAVAAILDSDVGGNRTFTDDVRTRDIGEEEPNGWYAAGNMRNQSAAAVNEFNGPGPYPILNQIGLSGSQIAALKTKITIAVYPVGSVPSDAAWLTERGYELVPEPPAEGA